MRYKNFRLSGKLRSREMIGIRRKSYGIRDDTININNQEKKL